VRPAPVARPAAHAHAHAPARVLEGAGETRPSHADVVHHAIEEIQSGDEHGVEELVDVLASEAPPFDRGEALEALAPIVGSRIEYDPDLPATGAANARALARLREWHRHVRGRLKFDRAARTFRAE